MTREEFTNMLVDARVESGVPVSEIASTIGDYPPNIYRMEKAASSYSMIKCFAYLKSIDCYLKVVKNKVSNSQDKLGTWLKQYCVGDAGAMLTDIYTYEDLIAWEKQVRGMLAQKPFSELIECGGNYIYQFENKIYAMTIDKFLKIADIFGYTIEVAKIK